MASKSASDFGHESRPWPARLLALLAIIFSGGALYGMSVASDPQTYETPSTCGCVQAVSEDDYRRFPIPSHNDRIFALRASLEERGYLLSGAQPISDNPLAAIRGIYGLSMPVEDSTQVVEWRLMATRVATCRPCSQVRWFSNCESFAPDVAQTLSEEWTTVVDCLPANVRATGEQLLARVAEVWEQDSAGEPIVDDESVPSHVLMRRWTTVGDGGRRYQLRLRQVTGDYQLEAQLAEQCGLASALPACELSLQFTWLGAAHLQLAGRP
jgi:hypothetical protein